MALKTAKMFKDFILAANDNAVLLVANEVVDVKVKNDNFANQVTIFDKGGAYNFFDYKYITFDGETLFEITDVIKNGKYNTLFIEYITNVKMQLAATISAEYQANDDMRVSGVTASTYQKLGLDVNELLRVLGKSTEQKLDITNGDNSDLFLAVKIRFSECPQNLNTIIYADPGQSTPTPTPRGLGQQSDGVVGKDVGDSNFKLSTIDMSVIPPYPQEYFTQFDAAFTTILPVPLTISGGKFAIKDVDEAQYYEEPATASVSFDRFLYALNALITDLTISAELTIFSTHDIITFANHKNGIEALEISEQTNDDGNKYYRYAVSFSWNDKGVNAPNATTFGGMLRTVQRPAREGELTVDAYYPIFCLNSYGTCGFAEVMKPHEIVFGDVSDDKILTSIRILNNEIDLRECRDKKITIWRRNNQLRVYQDFSRNIYTDIDTTFEYAQDTYSNFEAYKKANIELVQKQQNATLTQTQRQARDLQTVQNFFTGLNAGKSALTSLLSGKPSGAVDAIVNAGLQIAQSEITLNMQQQNERANQKLAQQQELERARDTIAPASELNGSVSLENASYGDKNQLGDFARYFIFGIRYFEIDNDAKRANIERYAFEQQIIDRITDNSQIVAPSWQTLHNFYQANFINKNPLNSRKAFSAFVENGSKKLVYYPKDCTLGSNLSIDDTTGFAYGFQSGYQSFVNTPPLPIPASARILVIVYISFGTNSTSTFTFGDLWKASMVGAPTTPYHMADTLILPTSIDENARKTKTFPVLIAIDSFTEEQSNTSYVHLATQLGVRGDNSWGYLEKIEIYYN